MRFLPVPRFAYETTCDWLFLNVTGPVIQWSVLGWIGMLRKGNVWPWHWLGWLGKRSAGRLCDHVTALSEPFAPQKNPSDPCNSSFFFFGRKFIEFKGAKLNTWASFLKGSWVFRNRNQHQRPRVSWSNNGLMDFSTVARKMRKASGSVSVRMLRWRMRWHVNGRICFMPNLGQWLEDVHAVF